jgi:beta-mannanase
MAASGQVVYVRLMGEMNGSWNPYSAYNANGTLRGRSHSTRNFRKAWQRVVLILRGGDTTSIDARLHDLGMPPLRGTRGTLPAPKVSFVWAPEVWGDPNVPGNAARAYWPGAAFVDWVGTDFYSKFPNYRGLNAFYDEFRGKPFAFGEWALWGRDDPAFVRGLFGWIRSHGRVRMAMYNQGTDISRSPFVLARYPRSAAALRQQLASALFAPLAPEFLQP